MDSLRLTLNSQDINYPKNPQLFFELCRNELEDQKKKKKYLHGNNKPFMIKALSKSIMERTRLRNTKKLLCITSKKSKKEIFCKSKRREYH